MYVYCRVKPNEHLQSLRSCFALLLDFAAPRLIFDLCSSARLKKPYTLNPKP